MFSAFQISAFQNSAFQIAKAVVSAVIGGGIPQKGQAKKRTRRFYVEYKNEILIFANADQANAWLENQTQLDAQQAKKQIKSRAKQLKVAPPLETIDLTEVKDIAERYGKSTTVSELLQDNQLADVVTYYKDLMKLQLDAMVKRIQDEEDELAMLLLAL